MDKGYNFQKNDRRDYIEQNISKMGNSQIFYDFYCHLEYSNSLSFVFKYLHIFYT